MNKLHKIINRLGLGKKLTEIRKWLDKKNSDQFECGIGDILLRRGVVLNNQLLLTSRLLDVEAFIEQNDVSFPFQNAISYKIYGKRYDKKQSDDAFKELIESYKKDGYHKDSIITCDSDMELVDGNHRMGLHIYEKIERVNVRRVARKMPYPYGSDEFYQKGFDGCVLPSTLIEKIYERYESVQQWLIESGNTFCAIIGTSNKRGLYPLKDFCSLIQPLKIFTGPFKLDLNGINMNCSGVVLFSLYEPNYVYQDGHLMSKRVAEVECIMRNRYDSNSIIVVSYNCLEGKTLYDKVKHTISLL